MLIAFTQSTNHLARYCTMPQLTRTLSRFPDDELQLHIDNDIHNKTVWIITATHAPPENILELLLLVDLCTRANAHKINIFFTYFGYARDSNLNTQTSSGAHTITQLLTVFPINNVHILHAHAADQLRNFLQYHNHIPYDFFCTAAHNADAIIAPDGGAQELALTIAQHIRKPSYCLQKKRDPNGTISIEPLFVDLRGMHVLIIDDIIASGQTMIHAIHMLKRSGAQSISIAATHGLCTVNVYQELAKMCKSVHISNSIHQTENMYMQKYNIWPLIENIVQTT